MFKNEKPNQKRNCKLSHESTEGFYSNVGYALVGQWWIYHLIKTIKLGIPLPQSLRILNFRRAPDSHPSHSDLAAPLQSCSLPMGQGGGANSVLLGWGWTSEPQHWCWTGDKDIGPGDGIQTGGCKLVIHTLSVCVLFPNFSLPLSEEGSYILLLLPLLSYPEDHLSGPCRTGLALLRASLLKILPCQCDISRYNVTIPLCKF